MPRALARTVRRLIVRTLLSLLALVGLVGAALTWHRSPDQPIRILFGDSMRPALGDYYVVRMSSVSEIQRGDIVSYRNLIHRVIGLAGESVAVRGGEPVLTVREDCVVLLEPYIVHQTVWDLNRVTLGPSEYLILPDNRRYAAKGSVDVVRRDEIRRKVSRVYYPTGVELGPVTYGKRRIDC